MEKKEAPPQLSALVDLVKRYKTADPISNIAVAPTNMYETVKAQVREMVYKNSPESARANTMSFFGIKILPFELIESDHCFFFETETDAQKFMRAIRNMKEIGMSWSDIMDTMPKTGLGELTVVKERNGH